MWWIKKEWDSQDTDSVCGYLDSKGNFYKTKEERDKADAHRQFEEGLSHLSYSIVRAIEAKFGSYPHSDVYSEMNGSIQALKNRLKYTEDLARDYASFGRDRFLERLMSTVIPFADAYKELFDKYKKQIK